jgi:hypothetical protein
MLAYASQAVRKDASFKGKLTYSTTLFSELQSSLIPEGKVSPDDVVVEAFAEGEPPFLADRLGGHGNQRDMPVYAQLSVEIHRHSRSGRHWQGSRREARSFQSKTRKLASARWESRCDETVAQPYGS